jgi:hypothetical protein
VANAATDQAAPQATTTGNASTAPPAATPPGDVDPAIVKAGYRPLRRNGTLLYCRNEVITGERIATQVCLTAEQIQNEKQNVAKAKDIMNQGTTRCITKNSCSN